jgi:hypothetical protein
VEEALGCGAIAIRLRLRCVNPLSRQTDRLSLAPCFGVAYKISGMLVFRCDYGIIYPHTGGGACDGFATTATLVSTNGGDGVNPNPVAPLSNPFPQGIAQPIGAIHMAMAPGSTRTLRLCPLISQELP